MARSPQPPESGHPTKTVSRRGVLVGLGGLTALAVLPGRADAAELAAAPPTPVTLTLSTTWKFAADPSRVGETQQWYADGFNDSGWQNLLSGKSWESQGVDFAGYGWYRQKFTVPSESAGAPMNLILASLYSDDDVWFNGVRIGGIRGSYKYNNRKLRTYSVPASAIRFGQSNTLTVRVWGGDLEFDARKNSGLIAGSYRAEISPYRLMARPPGAGIGAETPLELWDLSSAQQSEPFELVYRIDPAKITAADVSWRIQDLYGITIATGTSPAQTGSDGIGRVVASLNAATARHIYLAGRIKCDITAGATFAAVTLEHLSFTQRDTAFLPTLPPTTATTPYGTLKLVDVIDCSTPLDAEIHPYLQSAYATSGQRYNTPGSEVNVTVSQILGKQAREVDYGWYAYRIGRGQLTVGGTYLLRIEYAEDKPRYGVVEVQAGQNFVDLGWRNGLGAGDVYDPWPLSNSWQSYDIIVPIGKETLGAGGVGDGDGRTGLWVYIMNQVKPNHWFSNYSGGPAIASIKLYEIDPAQHAPTIRRPQGLPQRTLAVDWERQPTAEPTDIVKYAKLMGYSAISPLALQWAHANWAQPVHGFDSIDVDYAHYWVRSDYAVGSGQAPPPAVPGQDSIHVKYLQATKALGIDYIPRIEYGGSRDLPAAAKAIGPNGSAAKVNRSGGLMSTDVSNLLNPATFTDFKAYLDSLLKPYTAAYPQLKGALLRIRSDRMQASYGPDDIDLFCAETGTPKPGGLSNVQLAAWASTGQVGQAYNTWWHGKRAAFHQRVVDLLQTYRSDLRFAFYNWDPDKFAILRPDILQGAFAVKLNKRGTAAYDEDRAAVASYTAADFIRAMRHGDMAGWLGISRPSWGVRPHLYATTSGIDIYAPTSWQWYVDKPEYLNYFRTADGLAVSNTVTYNESVYKWTNPKYSAAIVLPAGGPFSMHVELMSWYHGDATTLNYTVYEYGRGFADAHRRFAQAYLALPAVPGNVVDGTPTDVRARTYATANGTYIGIAHKGYTAKPVTVDVPGPFTTSTVLTDLITGATVPTNIVGGKLRISVPAGPMQLYAFKASTPSGGFTVKVSNPEASISKGQSATFTVQTAATHGTPGPIQLSASGAPAGAAVTFSPGQVTPGGQSTMTVSTTSATAHGTAYLTVSGNGGGLSYSTSVVALDVQPDLRITNLWVADTANSSNWQTQPALRNHLPAYTDRNYNFSQVPAPLVGSQWIRTAVDSKSASANPLVKFTINKEAVVSVAVDTRLGRRSWMDSSWVQLTGQQFIFYDASDVLTKLDVYQKTFPAGEVALGPNGGTQASTTYLVCVTDTGGGGGTNPPAAPTNLTATAGDTSVALTWTASAGADSYTVKRATTSGGPYATVATGITGTGHTDTGLTNGTTYFYVVTAVNTAGESANSNQASATPSGGGGGATGTNETNYPIPERGSGYVESPITISGVGRNASATSTVEVHIIHPQSGDLNIKLIPTVGSSITLQSHTGKGKGADIHKTFAVDLSGKPADGTWALRVEDKYANDTGYIDSWTITV